MPVGAEAGGDARVEEGPDEDGEVGGFAEEVPVEVEGGGWVREGGWAGHEVDASRVEVVLERGMSRPVGDNWTGGSWLVMYVIELLQVDGVDVFGKFS